MTKSAKKHAPVVFEIGITASFKPSLSAVFLKKLIAYDRSNENSSYLCKWMHP